MSQWSLFSKLFSNGEDGIGFKRMRFSEDSEMTQRWRASNNSFKIRNGLDVVCDEK